MKIEVRYNSRQVKRSLVLGSVWTLLAASALFFAKDRSLFAGMLPMALFSLAYGLHLRYRNNFELNDDELVIHSFPFITRRHALADLRKVRYFAGEYILSFGRKEIRLDMNLVDAESVPGVKECFETLGRQVSASGADAVR